MESARIPVEIDAELVDRAGRAGAPSGRSATMVMEDAVRVFLDAEVIDVVRGRNRGVDPEEVAALARSELAAHRRAENRARR